MRHGRAKAARKTLQHFQRTVNLKNKPYYSVLLDATFLIAMIRITANNTGDTENSTESTIVSRIERVLQVNNNAGGASFSGFSRDERLSGVVGDYNSGRNWNEPSQQTNNNSTTSQGRQFERFKVRYFVPQEAVDEIETIVKTFKERSENTKKAKKKKEYEAKSKVFEDALAWIKKNSARRHSHRGSGRCEVLPKLEAAVLPPSKKKKKQPEESEQDKTDDEPVLISPSDAVRRHIARDDGREDPETNKIITKKEQKEQQSFSRTYIVASQEEDLLDDLRMLGTVPILRCANNATVLILENPSKKGQRTENAKEHSKWKGALQNAAERALVDAAWEAQKKDKVRITGVDTSTERQKSKAKGPNPLSCKRKRTENEQKGSGESKSKKRRARAKRNKSEGATATASSAKE